MIAISLLLAGVIFVAYSNGANDNFKGVATLYGSGTASYRGALAWATMTTFAGSLCSVVLAGKLVKAFSAKGLVPEAVAGAPEFLAAVALGAALTVFLATLTGFPISTTHALTGGLVGAGIATVGGAVNFALLGKSFFLPLIVSPLLAVLFAGIAYPVFRYLARRLSKQWCVCLQSSDNLAVNSDGTLAFMVAPGLEVAAGSPSSCAIHYRERLLGVSTRKWVDVGHYLSAGAVSFARGLNDTPKIVGLVFVIDVIDNQMSLFGVAAIMAIGGLLQARKVAETVGRRITRMDHGEGLAANLVTSLLVLTASHSGLPVSTTHVSCSSLFGIGLTTRKADTGVIRQILASWVLTLPIAAFFAAVIAMLLR